MHEEKVLPAADKPDYRAAIDAVRGNTLVLPAVSIVVLLVLASVLAPGFLSGANLWSLLSITAILAIASFGQTIVILAGGQGIDLSIGALMTLSALLVSSIAASVDANLPMAVLAIVAVCIAVGTLNFAGIFYVGIYPLIMTLGMAFVISGVVLLYAQARGAALPSPLMLFLGSGKFGPVPLLVIICAVVLAVLTALLKATNFGKHLYLVGANRRAARLSGTPVAFVCWLSYVASSLLAGLAGALLFGYAGATNLTLGDPYSLLSIAAAVVGGTALSGGQGSLFGSLLGAVIFIVLTNLLVALGLSPALRDVATGILLLAILSLTARDATS
jgi:ribose transport system permease protein